MKDVLSVIPKGKENAIHQQELAKILGLNMWQVKKAIQKERRNGAVILSDQNGYWISDDKEEIKAFLVSMRKQAISRFNSTKAINNSLREIEGQECLDTLPQGDING